MVRSYAKQITVAVVIAIMAVIAAMALLLVTKPYAITADGHKAYEAYAVKAGYSNIAYVQSEKEGREVIENIKKSYYKGKEEPKDLDISPAITIEKKELERTKEHIQLQNPKEAAKTVVAEDKSAKNPIITVSYTATEKNTKKIKYKTVYKKTNALKKGQREVAKSGKAGKRIITSKVSYENGKAIKTVVVDKEVAKKAVNRVVYKGTRVVRDTVTASRGKANRKGGGKRAGGSGQAIADYACRFVGNPYVYGGSSLTNGTDCSGFVMSVYAHYGVSLPHSASAIGAYGTGVSYSNARPGDVFIYPGHCGIYIGNGKIVHASSPGTGIIIGDALYTTPTTIRHFK